MNDHLSQEQTIHRLVDNQLSETDRAELLLAADQNPQLWRRITLAFIEEQVWSSAISGKNRESNLRPHINNALLASKQAASSASSIKPWFLALAAVVLIAVTISIRMITMGGDNTSTATPIDPDREKVAVNNEPYMLEMGDQKVPLYERSDLMSDFLARSEGELSPELLQYLQNAGLDVQPKTRYITGNAPDGRSFVFPVRQFSVRSRVQ